MSTWDGNNYYYSGQGVLLIGKRNSDGSPAGLVPVGNCPALSINIDTTTLEHKESQTGQRGIDLRLVTETKANISMTLENFNAINLALALRGEVTNKLAGAVTNEAPKGYLGKVVPLRYAQVSSVAVAIGSDTLAAYVNDSTAWDYKINTETGSLLFNDGQGSALLTSAISTGGVVPSAITVGNPTVITVANTASVGDYAVIHGLSGADAATLNGKAFEIVAASGTSVSLNVNTTGKTITIGTPKMRFDGFTLDVDYSYAGQNLVESLTLGSQERYLRFEGLNTADSNKAVVVEVFKFLVDPLQAFDLISDGIQQFVLQGSALADPLRSTGSKYFRQTLLR